MLEVVRIDREEMCSQNRSATSSLSIYRQKSKRKVAIDKQPTIFDCNGIDHIHTKDTGYTTDLRISDMDLVWLLYIANLWDRYTTLLQFGHFFSNWYGFGFQRVYDAFSIYSMDMTKPMSTTVWIWQHYLPNPYQINRISLLCTICTKLMRLNLVEFNLSCSIITMITATKPLQVERPLKTDVVTVLMMYEILLFQCNSNINTQCICIAYARIEFYYESWILLKYLHVECESSLVMRFRSSSLFLFVIDIY